MFVWARKAAANRRRFVSESVHTWKLINSLGTGSDTSATQAWNSAESSTGMMMMSVSLIESLVWSRWIECSPKNTINDEFGRQFNALNRPIMRSECFEFRVKSISTFKWMQAKKKVDGRVLLAQTWLAFVRRRKPIEFGFWIFKTMSSWTCTIEVVFHQRSKSQIKAGLFLRLSANKWGWTIWILNRLSLSFGRPQHMRLSCALFALDSFVGSAASNVFSSYL